MTYIGFDDETELDIKMNLYNLKLQDYKERWCRLYIDGEKTNYSISNHGNIKNRNTKKSMKSFPTINYTRITLAINNERRTFSIHRLVALHFCVIPKRYIKKGLTANDLVVNHKNGIKRCNAAFNLEWVTSKENTDHAWKEGLCDSIRGENAHLAKITEKEAREVIAMIMIRKTNDEIHEATGITKKTIQHIRSKECWKHLSHNLEFPKLGTSKPNTIPVETIHEVCKLLEEKKYSDYAIADLCNVSRGFVKDIRNHKRRKDISQYYNF